MRRLLQGLGLAGLALLGGDPAAPVAFPDEAYVWQRAWRPALGQALASAAPLVRQWRVLASEVQGDGRVQALALNASWLQASAKPWVMVVRVDGQLGDAADEGLVAGLQASLARWAAQGLRPAGLELDHDAALSRLPRYAGLLRRVRQALPPGMPLSITALPAWLGSPDLAQVLAEVDEVVLQVHAVRQPRAGLLDAGLARQWARAWSARSTRPFRLALPSYGSRVFFDAQGDLAGVDSEAPGLRRYEEERELVVTPMAVAALRRAIEENPPPHFAGWVWFRLPTEDDRRGWAPATWRAVLQRQPLPPPARLRWQRSAPAGRVDLRVENESPLDAELPAALGLPVGPDDCPAAEALGGYHLQALAGRWQLHRDSPGLLPPHSQRPVGWLRCRPGPSSFAASTP